MNIKSNPEQAAASGEISIAQLKHWDDWNSKYRQPETIDAPSKRRMSEVLAALSQLQIRNAKILEIGCSTGWLSSKLTEFGAVTAVDLAVEVIQTAKAQMPHIDFRSGDVMELDLPTNYFDVIVTLETFSHVSSQEKFVARMAELLKADGRLVLTTQNKFVFERRSGVVQNPAYTRRWVTMKELKRLVGSKFAILRATSLEPDGHLGILRILNSYKLNRLLGTIIGAKRLRQWKENHGLGQTLFIVAAKH
jgi:2-polyprenyl-3-methyl-5-hydroxy-6-metoxy-1,4-benzoquinol methylase